MKMEYTRTDIENELLVILKSEELATNHQPLIDKVIKWHKAKVENLGLFDVRLSLPDEDNLIKEFDKGLSKSKEKHNFSPDELIAMRGGWVACGNWLRDKFK